MRRSFDIDCTVTVSNRFEDLSAHVELDGDIDILPGDSVLVHGAPLHPAFGEVMTDRRRATVTRAGLLERAWTRITGDLECLSLLDVSFTDRRTI
jgi:hypothetical protein